MSAFLARQGVNQPWHPDNIGRDMLVAWWSAKDHGGTNMTDDGGGLISSWKDRISGINCVGATTERPLYSATGLRSGPALQFDGAGNRLTATAGFGAIPIGTASGEIYVRCSQDDLATSSTNIREVFHYGPGVSTAHASRVVFRAIVGGSNRGRISDPTGILTTNLALDGDFSGFQVIGTKFDSATIYGYTNGAAFSTPSVASAFVTTLTRLCIGASHSAGLANLWLGWVSDVIVISGVLSAAQRTNLMAYLAV
jgi:hypothetical protein